MLVLVFLVLLLVPASPATAQDAARVITLKDAIALAQRESPMRVAPDAIASATAEAARVAGRLPNPLFDFRTENWTPSTASLPLDIWATVSQPVELGGKRSIRRGLAVAQHDVAAADLGIADRRLAVQALQLYVQALRARGLLETVTATREGVSMLIDVMRTRLDEGYVAESDLLRFEAEAARLDVDIARARLDLARSLDALTIITGSAARIDAMQLVTPEAPPLPPADALGIPAAIAKHPDMRGAAARVGQAEQAYLFETARRLPDPAITAGFKRTLGISTVVAAVTATVPLFDRNGAARAVASGNVRAAAAERDATRARLISDATSLARAATTLAERASRANAELLEPAAGVRDAARAAFQEGAVDVLKVIDAERVYGEVRRVALDLQLEAIESAIETRIALGEEPLP